MSKGKTGESQLAKWLPMGIAGMFGSGLGTLSHSELNQTSMGEKQDNIHRPFGFLND
jgi:hypothetical protein